MSNFEPPSESQCQQALEWSTLSDHEKDCKCYQSQYFDKLGEQLWGNWLNQHKEMGQNFRTFMGKHENDLHCRQHERKIIYIYLLDDLLIQEEEKEHLLYRDKIGNHPCLEKVLEFLRAFYWTVTVKDVQPSKQNLVEYRSKYKFTSRINSFGKKQFLTGDIITFLKEVKPKDCYCMLAITSVDLYPKDDWNYAFGIANLVHQVGVVSHARFDPNFSNRFYPVISEKEREDVILKRSCKLASHEIGHLFKFKHCTYFDCGMNGYNSLDEADSTFIDFCPIEMRKLKVSIGFDEKERYQKLFAFFKSKQFSTTKWNS